MPGGRQVMVRGSESQIAQVKTLLTQLGEDGTGRKKGSDAGNFRRFPISGRDTAELLPLIERMWDSASPKPIRIVTPGQRGQGNNSGGTIKGIIRPNQDATKTRETDGLISEPFLSAATSSMAPSLAIQTTTKLKTELFLSSRSN